MARPTKKVVEILAVPEKAAELSDQFGRFTGKVDDQGLTKRKTTHRILISGVMTDEDLNEELKRLRKVDGVNRLYVKVA